MKNYVTIKFTEELNKSIMGEDLDDPYTLVKMGKCYVMFFIQNPQYYEFLFSQPCIKVDLNMEKGATGNFPPFELLKELNFRILRHSGLTEEEIKNVVMMSWATVHGLAGIATMQGVAYDGNWENKIEEIIWNKKGY